VDNKAFKKMKINLLYFGRPREMLQISTEISEIPEGIATLGELLSFLRTRGGSWAHELEDGRVRCSLNQEFASLDAPLREQDEVAIFSPISGG
jgi:sulfur-carrier protein